MEDLRDKFPKRPEEAFGRVLNRDLFLFLLDLEVKRARRYQNFLCLVLLKIKQFSEEGDGGGLQACCQTLSNFLIDEMRESDILGSLELGRLVVLLPYADGKAGTHVQSRFEDALKYFDFKSKGYEIMINKVCFPINGTGTMDLIKKALGET